MNYRTLALLAVVAIGTAGFAQNWVQWTGNGHWYRAVQATDGISWTQAQLAAVSSGGYLATLTSSDENDFVFGLVKNLDWWEVQQVTNVFGPWIGLYQLPNSPEPGGGFVWVNGEQSDFRSWMAGEPNDNHGQGGEDKVHMIWRLDNPQPFWNDLADAPGQGDTLVRGYVIETDIGPTITLTPYAQLLNLGKVTLGNLASLAQDDNDAQVICKFFVPNQNSPFVSTQVSFSCPFPTPSAMDFVVKSKWNNSGSYRMSLWQFNFATNTYDDLADSNLSGSFTTYSGSATGTLKDYVNQSTGETRARISVRQTGPSTAFLPCVSFEYANQVVAG